MPFSLLVTGHVLGIPLLRSGDFSPNVAALVPTSRKSTVSRSIIQQEESGDFCTDMVSPTRNEADDEFALTDEFLADVFNAMRVLSVCDSRLCENELRVLRDYIETYELEGVQGISTNEITDFEPPSDPLGFIARIANNCSKDRHRYFLLDQLSRIADADAAVHARELEVLQLLRSEWGFDPVLTKPISNWTDRQLEVINAKSHKRILVDAPPGSGKTALIVARIRRLLEDEHLESSNIWMISFTRTAVRELRDRLSLSVANYPRDIRVSTLDSTVFWMNLSLGAAKDELFGGYEESIEAFLQKLRDRNPDLLDFLDNLEHVVIDESQDLVGLRKELCLEVIRRLPSDCGVTLLGDEFQQIYGSWSHSGDQENSSLLQDVESDKSLEFQRVELTRIHRTSSPTLLDLVEDLRLDLAVFDGHEEDDLKRRREMVRSKLPTKSWSDATAAATENYLILFRLTKDVLTSVLNLLVMGRPFRLRLPRYPQYIAPWVNDVFTYAADNSKQRLEQPDIQRVSDSLLSRDSKYVDSPRLFEHMLHTAGDSEAILVNRLREVLGKSMRPPVEFQNPEFGYGGPILGTVHSSKGREADHVYFRLPQPGRRKTLDRGEESRVIFVGVSRAKSDVHLLDENEPSLSWTRLNKPERYVRKVETLHKSPPRILAEIGLEGDYDHYSCVKRTLTVAQIEQTQAFLKTWYPSKSTLRCFAKRDPVRQMTYSVYAEWDDREIYLGELTDAVYDAFLAASTRLYKWKYQAPVILQGLQIVDVGTYVATRDDPMLAGCNAKVADRGSWLFPVIFGLGPFRYLVVN